jgi:hypothetical protein
MNREPILRGAIDRHDDRIWHLTKQVFFFTLKEKERKDDAISRHLT